eukprot:TRINITY_DN4345_c0_g1_i1.p1 TRINITY_DN4345_c0_g1~~TRINITY_DN4345_c0_g1_i1.p1  ORF type:complete len:130 (-),score=15.77 TRINITY_DN4345_c0_g1_i1:40-429(-)
MKHINSLPDSGFAWLVRENSKLQMYVTLDSETVVKSSGIIPLLSINLWQHAYFPRFGLDKTSYVDTWFHNANWKIAERRFNEVYIKETSDELEVVETPEPLVKRHIRKQESPSSPFLRRLKYPSLSTRV